MSENTKKSDMGCISIRIFYDDMGKIKYESEDEKKQVELFMEGRAFQIKLGKIGKDGEVKSKIIKVFKKESD